MEKSLKKINLAEELSDEDIENLINKGELMSEEEYLERWFFDFLRENRKHCPDVLNNPSDEFAFLDKWPNVLPLIFPVPNTYVDSQHDQIYDVRYLDKIFPSYRSKNIHALSVIKDACKEYYSVSEYIDIINDINMLTNSINVNKVSMIHLDDVDEIADFYAEYDKKDVVDMINSQEIIISDNVDEFLEDLLEKSPDAVLSLDLTEEVCSLKNSHGVTFRQLLLDFYIKHGKVVELKSGRYYLFL